MNTKEKQKEYNRNRRLKWKLLGVCTRCGKWSNNKSLCLLCSQYILDLNRKASKKQRQKALEHYGNKCVCCGETTYEFLTFDHINNDGALQRKVLSLGKNRAAGNITVRSFIKNGYPNDIQILCYNCNCSKGFYGFCPHTLGK